jgi:hypothetical protein
MSKQLLAFLIFSLLTFPHSVSAMDAFRFVHSSTILNDSEEKKISRPEGVACNDKVIVVADTGHGRLVRYSLANDYVSGGEEILTPQIKFPIRVHLTSRGDILVLDGQSKKLVRLGQKGDFIETVELLGLPNGFSPVLRSFALDQQDNMYLLDIFDEKIIVLNAKGAYQKDISLPKVEGFFSDVTVGPQGTIYLLNSVESIVYAAETGAQVFTALENNLAEYVNFPATITVSDKGILFLVDRNGGGIVQLGPDGSYMGRQLTMGWNEGLLYYPDQMCLSNTDEPVAIIADRDNSRVQVFKLIR